MKAKHVRQQLEAGHVGLIRPATAAAAIWGSVLPIPAGPGASDDFEARVQRAWSYIKATYFAAAEHGRLRKVLAEMVTAEASAR